MSSRAAADLEYSYDGGWHDVIELFRKSIEIPDEFKFGSQLLRCMIRKH